MIIPGHQSSGLLWGKVSSWLMWTITWDVSEEDFPFILPLHVTVSSWLRSCYLSDKPCEVRNSTRRLPSWSSTDSLYQLLLSAIIFVSKTQLHLSMQFPLLSDCTRIYVCTLSSCIKSSTKIPADWLVSPFVVIMLCTSIPDPILCLELVFKTIRQIKRFWLQWHVHVGKGRLELFHCLAGVPSVSIYLPAAGTSWLESNCLHG